jgi:3-oxoacyl-[acyl-carrier protein] reductase
MMRVYPTYPDLENKIVLVTGSSRGLGAETCRAFAANGAKVVVNGRDSSAVAKVVADIQARGGEALGIVADCTKRSELEAMRLKIEGDFGSVDILAAFAGGGDMTPGPVEKITEEGWHSSVDGSLTSTFLSIKTFLPSMAKRKAGAIITMASTAARQPSPMSPVAYAAAKAGVIALTRCVATQVAPSSIRVNCLAPSAIFNDRMKTMARNQLQQLAQSYPLGRVGQPHDVAQATLFLASDASSWMTGITLDIAGGNVML